LKRTLFCCFTLVVASLTTMSCGGGSSNANRPNYRAFVSNPLYAGAASVLNIVDAQHDLLSAATVGLTGTLTQPSQMTLSPNLRYTLVYSPVGPTIALVDNTTQGLASGTGSLTLPGASDSMLIASDNATGYVAVPGASSITGQAPGAVLQIDLLTDEIESTLTIPSAHYIASSNSSGQILVFSDNSNVITVISPILIGTTQNPLTTIQDSRLDRPIGAIFSSDNAMAYIFNCGPECGGKQASIAVLQTATNQNTGSIPLSGATAGLLSGTTLYVAGSPPGTACGAGTSATNCGTLNIINTSSLALTNSSPILITDGWHNHLELSADGQLFIGSHTCTNVSISGGEVRGCLTIYNTTTSAVIVPPFAGDVTGIAPILGRNIVYVVQNATLNPFDTTTDQLEVINPATPLIIVGQPFDVKYVDPPIPN